MQELQNNIQDHMAGKEILKFQSNCQYALAVDISPDNKEVVAGFSDGSLIFWDIEKNKQTGSFARTNWARSVAYTKCGKVFVGDDNATISVWSIDSQKQIGEDIKSHAGFVSKLLLSPNSRDMLSIGSCGLLKIWDTKTLAGRTVYETDAWIKAAAHTPCGRAVLLGEKNQIIAVCTSTNKITKSAPFSGCQLSSLAISSNGNTILGGTEDGLIRMWDRNLREIKTTQHGTATVTSSPAREYTPNNHRGHNASLSYSKSIPPSHSGKVSSLVISPDQKTFITSSFDGNIRHWDLKSLTPLANLEVGKEVNALRVAPSGKFFAAAYDGGLTTLNHLLYIDRNRKTKKKELGVIDL